MNDQNLRAFDKMSKEEHIALSRKGGLEAARRRRELMEQAAENKEVASRLHEILCQDIPDGELKNKVSKALKMKNPTYLDAIAFGSVRKAIQGNAMMFNSILEALGQKETPKSQIEVTGLPFAGIDINVKK